MSHYLAALLFAASLLFSTGAQATCNGQFPANTVCGNPTGSTGNPNPVPLSSFGTASSITVGNPVIGGTNSYLLGISSGGNLASQQFATLAQGGLGGDQSAATAGQIPIYPGIGGAAVPTTYEAISHTWTQPQAFNGGASAGQTLTITPQALSLVPGLVINQSGPASSTASSNQSFNSITIASDQTALASGPYQINGFNLTYNTGGLNTSGARVGINALVNATAAVNSSGSPVELVGIGGTVFIGPDFVPTFSGANIVGYGANFVVKNNATSVSGISGIEVDMLTGAGSSETNEVGYNAVLAAQQSTPSGLVSAFVASGINGTPKYQWQYGYVASDYNGAFGIAPTGTVLASVSVGNQAPPYTVAYAIDFSNLSPSNAFWKGAFSSDGAISSTKFISTVATGTAPLVVSSTTNVANLNASSLNGATFAAPGAIGGGTAAAGTFTTLYSTSTTVTTAFTATGLVTLADLATQATNTVLGNATSGSASPTALAVSSCSAAGDALIWTTNTGFGCNTSITAAAVPASGITGTTLASNVVTSSLTTVGTIGTGAWQGTVIAGLYGGTGQSTAAVGDILYASATTPTWSRLAAVGIGSVLVSEGVNTAPGWSATPSLTTLSIGTPTLNLNSLTVNGGVAIGTYATTNNAPTNGLIVSGQVCFGCAGLVASDYSLQITGYTLLTNNTVTGPTNSPGGGVSFGWNRSSGSGEANIYATYVNGAGIDFWQNTGAPTTYTKMAAMTTTSFTLAGTLTVSGITTDAGHTDATVCEDTTSHQFYSGTGTLGICLGTSGRQFKTAFAPMVAGLDQIMALPLVNYRYRPGYGDGGLREQYGLVAQDVAAVMPDLVGRDGNGDIINYDAGALLFVSMRAIQQLKGVNDNIEARLDRLERKIAR